MYISPGSYVAFRNVAFSLSNFQKWFSDLISSSAKEFVDLEGRHRIETNKYYVRVGGPNMDIKPRRWLKKHQAATDESQIANIWIISVQLPNSRIQQERSRIYKHLMEHVPE